MGINVDILVGEEMHDKENYCVVPGDSIMEFVVEGDAILNNGIIFL